MQRHISSPSIIAPNELSVLIRQAASILGSLFVLQIPLVLYFVKALDTAYYLSILGHIAAILLVLLNCARQRLLAARRLLNLTYTSYLCCACATWGMAVGIQHFLLLGITACGYLYLPSERTEKMATALCFGGIFIAIEYVSGNVEQWHGILRLTTSLALVCAFLLILIVLQRPGRQRWPTGKTQTLSSVSVLFADLQGYTRLSELFNDEQVVSILDDIYCEFDVIAKQYGVEKLKTNGDEYMAAVGIHSALDNKTGSTAPNAVTIYQFAWQIKQSFQHYRNSFGLPCDLRIGIASGTVTAGIIGKDKPLFDIWGRTVNQAARLEHAASPGTILLCENAYHTIASFYQQPVAVAVSRVSVRAFEVTHPPPFFTT